MELIIFAILGLTLGALESWASSLGTDPSTPGNRERGPIARITVRASRETARNARLVDLMTVREERAHAGRMERLAARQAAAEELGDAGEASKFERLLSLEEARHREKLRRLAQ